jgi:trafficking protein particle complex subunit 2
MFVILTAQDKPLYEKRLQFKRAQPTSHQILNAQFSIHASLDILEEKIITQKEL